MEQDNRNRAESGRQDDVDLDQAMERDTEIRRDTQVRGSLGIPPSGQSSERSGESDANDEGVPEFERGSDEDRGSER
jgi:hypothetical protein